MPVIGWLNVLSPGTIGRLIAAFHRGLKEVGCVEGQNLAIEYHSADGDYARLPAMAAELARRQVAVIRSGNITSVNCAVRQAVLNG